MREMLVAVFDTEANAERAIQALTEAGVSANMIRRYHRDDTSIPHRATHSATEDDVTPRRHQTSGGFWSWLMGEEGESSASDESYRHDYPSYGRAIEAGRTVIGVTVEQADVTRVMDLLANQVPVELDDLGPSDNLTQQGTASRETNRIDNEDRIGRAHTREEVIPLAEEQVNIGTRKVSQGGARVRRYVVEQPVERQVNLRDEHVEIERRKPLGAQPDAGAFQERTVEARNTREEPEVTKTARVGEEVVVRKEVTERPETVRTTERKEHVEIDQPKVDQRTKRGL